MYHSSLPITYFSICSLCKASTSAWCSSCKAEIFLFRASVSSVNLIISLVACFSASENCELLWRSFFSSVCSSCYETNVKKAHLINWFLNIKSKKKTKTKNYKTWISYVFIALTKISEKSHKWVVDNKPKAYITIPMCA